MKHLRTLRACFSVASIQARSNGFTAQPEMMHFSMCAEVLLIAAITDAMSVPFGANQPTCAAPFLTLFVKNISSFSKLEFIGAECEYRRNSIFFSHFWCNINFDWFSSLGAADRCARHKKHGIGKMEKHCFLIWPMTKRTFGGTRHRARVCVWVLVCGMYNLLTNHPLEIHSTFSFQFSHLKTISLPIPSSVNSIFDAAIVEMCVHAPLLCWLFLSSFRQPAPCRPNIHTLFHHWVRVCLCATLKRIMIFLE